MIYTVTQTNETLHFDPFLFVSIPTVSCYSNQKSSAQSFVYRRINFYSDFVNFVSAYDRSLLKSNFTLNTQLWLSDFSHIKSQLTADSSGITRNGRNKTNRRYKFYNAKHLYDA